VCPHRIGYGFEIPATSESFARIYKGVEIDSQSFETMKQRYTFPYPSYLKSLALSAVAVGHFYGIEPRQIAQILADFEGVPGRMRKMEKQGLNIYDDTYNSNPSSLKSALEFLASFKGGKRFAVLGDMMELGEFASEEHRSAIELCRKLELDGWFTQGKCFANILLSNNFLDSLDIVEALLRMVRPRDVVLFKGSRAMKMETVLKLFLERLERI
jgi:UDP-N-acetylmuramoyl-tripeptide--D-alanyl-D-alanine ligase